MKTKLSRNTKKTIGLIALIIFTIVISFCMSSCELDKSFYNVVIKNSESETTEFISIGLPTIEHFSERVAGYPVKIKYMYAIKWTNEQDERRRITMPVDSTFSISAKRIDFNNITI
jgi:hypothetical protein